MHPMPLFILMQLLWTDIWKHIVETSQINNKLVQICLLSGRRFEKTFENTHRKRSNKCIQCNFVSSYTSTLNRHLKTHSGGKPNKCNQCEYPFCWAGDLRRHLTSQTGGKPNKCNQCKYVFSQAGDLRRPLITHSGEKSNKCKQCDFVSSQAGNF